MSFFKSQTIAAAFLSIALPTQAQEPSVLKTQDVKPLSSVQDSDMHIRFYGFGDKYKKGMRTIEGGMYDEIVGVACEWHLKGKSDNAGTFFNNVKVSGQSCKQMEEPASWKEQTPVDIAPFYTTVERSIFVDDAYDTATEVSGSFLAEDSSYTMLSRKWDKANSMVCLKTSVGTAKDGGFTPGYEIDNGCFKLSAKDFLLKSMAATAKASPI